VLLASIAVVFMASPQRDALLHAGAGHGTDGNAPRSAVPRGIIPVASAGVAVVMTGWDMTSYQPSGTSALWAGGPYLSVWSVAVLGVAVLLLVGGVLRLDPPVRRRVISGAVPVLVAIPLVRVGFGAVLEHNLRHPEAIDGLNLFQWSGLVLIPLIALAVTADLNRRLEATRSAAGSRDAG
jgi:hypothetical protein